ncbi:MAG: hypothetical protein AAF734_11630, partial [Bacteroidota bacterium]
MQAGYFTFNLYNDKIVRLYRSLCTFETKTSLSTSFTHNQWLSLLKVASNMVSRGLPTYPSSLIKETLENRLELPKKLDLSGLYAIDPRSQAVGDTDSNFEVAFLTSYLPDKARFLVQILERQRLLSSIITDSEGFERQQVDFSIEFPEPNEEGYNGLIIEVDGFHHHEDRQIILDTIRDSAAADAEWKTFRIRNGSEQSDTNEFVKEALETSYFQQLQKNYQNKAFNEERLNNLQWFLSPLAVARIQKALLELLIEGKISLEKEVIKIAVLERDVPCGELALEDLQQLLSHLLGLANSDFALPQ